MRKAYVLYRISYSNKHIIAVFDTRELATNYAKTYNVPSWFVEESQYFRQVA